MSTPPRTLPADFAQWDEEPKQQKVKAAPQTLPADFAEWDDGQDFSDVQGGSSSGKQLEVARAIPATPSIAAGRFDAGAPMPPAPATPAVPDFLSQELAARQAAETQKLQQDFRQQFPNATNPLAALETPNVLDQVQWEREHLIPEAAEAAQNIRAAQTPTGRLHLAHKAADKLNQEASQYYQELIDEGQFDYSDETGRPVPIADAARVNQALDSLQRMKLIDPGKSNALLRGVASVTAPRFLEKLELYGLTKKPELSRAEALQVKAAALEYIAEKNFEPSAVEEVIQAAPAMAEFIGEVMLTGGIYTGVKQAVERGLVKGGEKIIGKQIAGQVAKNVGRVAGIGAQALAGAAVTPETTGANVVDRMTHDGDSFGQASTKVLANKAVELGTERIGGKLDFVGKALGLDRVAQFAAKRGWTVPEAVTKLRDKAQLNSFISEFIEEQPGKPVQAAIEQFGKDFDYERWKEDTLKQYSARQLGVEAALVGGLTGTVTGIGYGAGKLRQGRQEAEPSPAKVTPNSPENPLSAEVTPNPAPNVAPNPAPNEHPEVPGGKVVGIDAESGLPIIKRASGEAPNVGTRPQQPVPVTAEGVKPVSQAAETGSVHEQLRTYAQTVVSGGRVKSVELVGSQAAKGAGNDTDIIYDFGQVGLPEDEAGAVEALENLIESSNIDVDKYDTFIKADGRHFHISSGAGRGIVENNEYAKEQNGRPRVLLASGTSTPDGTTESSSTPPAASPAATGQQGTPLEATSAPESYPQTLPADSEELEQPETKQPWQMTQGYVSLEKAKQDFPITSKVEVRNGKPVYTHSTTVKWDDGEKSFEIETRGQPNGADLASRLHKKVIEQAIAEGKPVPPEVLADYPDLKPAPVERRKNIEQRKKVADMTPEEKDRALLTSEKTGIPNYRAFHEQADPSKPVTGYLDLDDFHNINGRMTHPGVDEVVLPEIGRMAERIAKEEGLDIYHRTGDEFLVRGGDEASVQRVLQRMVDELATAEYEYIDPSGTLHRQQGVGASYGTGSDEVSAEARAKQQKAERKAAGLRIGARDEAISGESTQGQPDNQVQTAGQQPEVEPAKPKVPSFLKPKSAEAPETGVTTIVLPVGAAAEKPSKPGETPFPGGRIVENAFSYRIQIFHDEKPSRDVINTLKRNGFHWAPSIKAWQRQLNANGRAAAERVTGVKLGQQQAEAPKPAEEPTNPAPTGDLVIKPVFGGPSTTISSQKLDETMEQAAEKDKARAAIKEGDRVRWNQNGKELSGTVRSRDGEELSVDTDQKQYIGGRIPIGRIEHPKVSQVEVLREEESENNLTPTVESGSTIQPSEDTNAQPEQTRSTTADQSERDTDTGAAERPAIQEPTREGRDTSAPVSPEGNEDVGESGQTPVSIAATNAGVLGGTESGETSGDVAGPGAGDSVSSNPPARRKGRQPKVSGEVTTGADGQPVEAKSPEAPAQAAKTIAEIRNKRNFRMPDDVAPEIGSGGEKTKINANLDAIALLKKLQEEGRVPTAAEQKQLASYVDFGGLRAMFDRSYMFREENDRLESLLTDEEIAAIKETSINTHYTALPVVDQMWKAVKRLGFGGGSILEPGMGIGNFFGRIPADLSKRSALIGVEKNIISGQMASMLYPDAKIVIKPYEQVAMPNDSVDLIIGNPPFAEIKIFDPLYNKPKFSVHNYFIVKSLDKLKPGGIAALITSHYTMDGNSSSSLAAREAMFERADLVGAIRLPGDAFKKTAGTEVTTDILFFRKRLPGEQPSQENSFLAAPELTIGEGSASVNEYFHEHPEMVLGENSLQGSMYRKDEYTVKSTGEIVPKLAEAIKKLPKDIAGEKAADVNLNAGFAEGPNMAPQEVKENAFYVDEKGSVRIKQKGAGVELPPELNKPATIKHLKDAVELRDALKTVIAEQMSGASDHELKLSQQHLNRLYDQYRKKYGELTGPKTARVFQEDPEYPLLTALENIDPESKAVSKADIFSKRTARPYEPLRDLPQDPKAAMLKVMAEKGRLDLPLMSRLMKKPQAEIEQDLASGGFIFRDPISGAWSTADEYLSGNVRIKLRQAEAAAELDDEFKRNVEELKKVQPEPLSIGEIDIRLGQTWIPTEIYAKFLERLAGTRSYYDGPKIHRDLQGRWLVELPNEIRFAYDLVNKWGAGGLSGGDLVETALNLQQPTIYHPPDKDGHRALNAEATAAARAKLQEIKDEFEKWVRGDQVKPAHKKLEELYNDAMNGMRRREFDGSHLEFPGLSPVFTPRTYQSNAAWRIVQEGRALLAHDVGTGKTLTMIIAGMELKRTGLSRKNFYVVPNNMVPQWREDFKKAYPGANVLAVTDKDLSSAKNRRRLMSRVATNEWDAVIVPHSQFNMLPISPERETKTLKSQLQEVDDILNELKAKKGGKRKGSRSEERTLRQIEVARQKVQQRLVELAAGRKDNTIYFDDLGIDMLFIDEAHAYKALPFYTKMGNISGLSNRKSQRAQNVLAKIQYMYDSHNGRGVVFATGTPITNTMGENYLMTKYIAPDVLEKAGIRHFDDWAANFATAVTRMEYSTDGVTIRPKASLSEFLNVPELQQMWSAFADVVTQEEALKSGTYKVPKAKRKDVLVKVTPAQEPMLEAIAKRGERLLGYETHIDKETGEEIKVSVGRVDPKVDNWLKLDSDSRDASLDARFVESDADDHPDSKANAAAIEAKRVLDETAKERGTVLIVGDRFQRSDGTFNIFKNIKEKLVRQGVPAKEIAIVHDYPKRDDFQALQNAVREGKVRVVLGTTERLGIGVNIQTRLKALLHLDLPQRPDQVEQREGRIIRHGNTWGEVEVIRFISEPRDVNSPKAHDLQRAQLLERKQTFLTQFKSGGFRGRHIEDLAGDVRLSPQMFALAKAAATGNPQVMEKIKIEHEMKGLTLLNRQYTFEKNRLQYKLDDSERNSTTLREVIPEEEKVVKAFSEKEKRDSDGKLISFELSIDGHDFTTMKDVNEYLKANPVIGDNTKLIVNGLDILLNVREMPIHGGQGRAESVSYKLGGTWWDAPYPEKPGTRTSAQSVVTSILQRGRNFNDRLTVSKTLLAKTESEIPKLKADIAQPSPYDEKLAKYQKRLDEIQQQLLGKVKDVEEIVDAESESEEPEQPEKEREDDEENIPPGPGSMNVRSKAKGREVRESDLAQLTNAVRSMGQSKPSFLSRIRNAGKAARESVSIEPLQRAVETLKSASSAMWQKYKTGAVAYTDWDSIVRSWSGAHQEVDLEARDFSDAVKKNIPDKLRREAMTNFLEAEQDTDTLRGRAAASTSKFRGGYELAQELTADERIFVNNISNFMDSDLTEAVKAGILEAGVENYIQHIWKRSASKDFVNKVLAEINYSSLQPNPSFSKKRVWETYFEGEQLGAEPMDKDIAFLATVHHQSLAKAIADRRFIKSLFEGTAKDGRPLAAVQGGMSIPDEQKGDDAYIIRPSQRNKDTGDYIRVDHPALRRWKWVGKDEAGNQAFMQGDIIVHPEIAQKLKNVLGRSWFRSSMVGRGLLKGSATFKQILLAGIPSFFHQSAVAVHAMEHRVNPAFNVVKLDMSDPKQKKLVHSGIMVADFNAMEGFSEGLATGGIITRIPLYGRLVQAHTDYLFKNYIPRLKMTMALHALDRNMERYSGELSEDKIYMLTADQANAAFGELNYKALSRNPTFQDGLRLFLLAPDFLEARARFAGQALRPYGKEQAVALALGAAVMYAVGRILSAMLSDDHDPHFDKPFSAVIGKKEYSLRTVQGDVAHLVSNPRNFAYWRLNPTTTRTAMEWVTGRNAYGIKRDATQQFQDFVEAHSPITGKPFFTRDPRKKRATWSDKLVESVLQTVGINQRNMRKPLPKTRVKPKPGFFDKFKPKPKQEAPKP
jgi:N12 class adenine-specific DNA methylase/GGDEF domain-containing protein